MLFEKNLSPPFCSVALYGKFEKDITKREREREREREASSSLYLQPSLICIKQQPTSPVNYTGNKNTTGEQIKTKRGKKLHVN
jgi:hypothetical protein